MTKKLKRNLAAYGTDNLWIMGQGHIILIRKDTLNYGLLSHVF